MVKLEAKKEIKKKRKQTPIRERPIVKAGTQTPTLKYSFPSIAEIEGFLKNNMKNDQKLRSMYERLFKPPKYRDRHWLVDMAYLIGLMNR